MAPDTAPSNSWNQWSRYVLKMIETIVADTKELRGDMVEVKQDLATLKAQARTWGAVAGIVTGMIVSIVVGLLMRGL